MKDKPRIHLIFDYVDDDFVLPERVQLTTDDVILQTRRSIDLKRDVMNYQVENSQPRFIIIGAQVCVVLWSVNFLISYVRRKLARPLFMSTSVSILSW